ncbi:MAG: glycerate kinase [Clostridiales bacterium]|nr:glycerate kinase [Clostridiales bacterium]
MKKIAVVSDSFKGSLTSSEICAIVAKEAARFFPSCEIVGLPVADGGEGTVDSFLQCMKGEKVALEVTGPNFMREPSFYGNFGDTAIIEMAAAAGLPMVADQKDPARTTTFGVGELMRHALEHGAKRIVLALGGSATNDGGCGAAAAMGTRFFSATGETFVPVGGTLSKIVRIDNTETKRLLEGVEVVAMCDIDNPMHGQRGAAYVFSPQKGADPDMVRLLDQELVALDEILVRELDAHVAELPGAGSAGAMGAGAVAFFGASLRPGIETVLDTVRFEERTAGADFVITGEGRLDSQSLRGKVVIGVSRRAKRMNIPVFAVVGDVDDDIDEAYREGVTAIFSTNHLAIPVSEAKKRSTMDYRLTIENLFRALAAMETEKKTSQPILQQ